MNLNRQFTGWIVAGALAIALGGVIIYEAASGGSGTKRTAALGSAGAQSLPSAVSSDFNQIQEAKSTGGTHELPQVGAQQHPTHLTNNPPQHCDPNDEPNVRAEWRNNPKSLNEAGNMSDQIVVGTPTGTSAGTPFSVNVAGEPNNPQVTPVQNVTFHVTQTVKGSAGGTVTIQRLGDAAGCFRVMGDEQYQQGQKYLLLLENGAGNRPPHTLGPSGRYLVQANGTLMPEHSSLFSDQVSGDKLGQVINLLRQ